MSKEINLIEEHFKSYSAAVAQSRVFVDVRDGLKPSLRQILYANYTDKYVGYAKKAKFLRLIGSASRFAWHGDASTYGSMIRAAKPFAMRYPLYGTQGEYGSPISPTNHAAPRYVEGYLSGVAEEMFRDLERDTIDDWRDNYDDTEKYPAILPSLGYWNLCNGSTGIGVGLASSIPQFNLIEMNEALSNMLLGKPYTLPFPDFATGGILMNKSEVAESLKAGTGKACKLRSKIVYNEKDHTLEVKEMPYSVYTNTICKQLEELLEDKAPGIDSFIDVTKERADIRIKLTKGANPEKVLQMLYAKTSLESSFGVNLTMLDNGRVPKVFTLEAAMKAFLGHQVEVYRKSLIYQKNKLLARVHILDGYLIILEDIERVVQIIKKSATRQVAAVQLIKTFDLSELQADAVLKLTLSRLASLEIQKFIDEREEALKEISRLDAIITSKARTNEEISKILLSTAEKYGDKRRTELLDQQNEIERFYYFTGSGRMGLNPPKDEAVISALPTGRKYLFVTRDGRVYRIDEQPKRLKKVLKLKGDDQVVRVFVDDNSAYLSIISESGNFRCIAVESLNTNLSTLTIAPIKEVYLTKSETTKNTYKKIVENEGGM